MRLPPGLLGDALAAWRSAPKPQAQAGTCGAAERNRQRDASAPVRAPTRCSSTGSVYLTGPYEGAPFGLSIVVPADRRSVRPRHDRARRADRRRPAHGGAHDHERSAAAEPRRDPAAAQDASTSTSIAQASSSTRPTAGRWRSKARSRASRARPRTVSSRFQAANCATLAFKPKLSALAHAQTEQSRRRLPARAARLRARPGERRGAEGRRAQAAAGASERRCRTRAPPTWSPPTPPAARAASVGGQRRPSSRRFCATRSSARATSSHTAARRSPDLEFVLQGDGVRRSTSSGRRSSSAASSPASFRSLPDVPISTLGLVLDVGPHSLLTANLPADANGSLCGQRLAMPTAITGQNGAVLKQTDRSSPSRAAPSDHRQAQGVAGDASRKA